MNISFGKIVGVLALSLFILVGFASVTSAQSELLFGQNHFYTVIFRGNGEAITYAKIAITNPDEESLTEFSFEVPKVSPTEMVIYQMKLPQECQSYNYNDPARPCIQYRDPDYAQQYYYYGYSNGKAEYQKIQYIKSGDSYKFTLPTPVEPYKSTAIIVAYAAKGYVSERAGLFQFNFEALKVPSRVQEIRVVVDVDSDLLLKGKKSSVNYNVSSLKSSDLSESSAISGRSLDNVVGKIGSYGPLVKEAKNLSPNEGFIVRGEYATSWFRLYLGSILLTIFIIIAIFTGVYCLARFLKKRNGRMVSEAGQQMTPQSSPKSDSIVNLANASVGLLSAIGVVGLTYLLRFLAESTLLQSFNPDPVFAIIIAITIILMYVLVIIGPAITMAIKHGWKSFLSVLVAEFLWFVIFLIIYFTFFQSELTPRFFGGGSVIY
jgi:hypothetical protein